MPRPTPSHPALPPEGGTTNPEEIRVGFAGSPTPALHGAKFRSKVPRPMIPAASLLTLLAALLADTARAASVDYVHDVKPLLTQHCSRCHGESKIEGGLRLDTAESLFAGGDSGDIVVAGESGSSLLMRVITGTHRDIPAMPYKKPPLEDTEIAILKAWIDEGAKGAPANEEPGVYRHWSFEPAVHPAAPVVQRAAWPRNPIDSFILARLEAQKITPAPEADRITLLRRVSLDLTGLPPTPAELEAFLGDAAPDAYERAVDRLLASPHHGERWARPWLDAARYADSNGYSIDAPRQIWKYRDWVVAALNRDLPYNQFVIEQLAGDLLPKATVEQKVATGFNRNTQINQEGGIDPEQFRIEGVLDRVNTFGASFLGLTVGCAQCHDHKFDPISQRDYYQLFAFFNNTVDDGHGQTTPGGTLAFPDESISRESQERELEEARTAMERYVNGRGQAVIQWLDGMAPEERAQAARNVRVLFGIPWDQLTLGQKRTAYGAFKPDDKEFAAIDKKFAELEKAKPQPVTTLVMSELPKSRESYLFIKGDFTRRGEPVAPRTPAIFPPVAAAQPTRLDLAQWTVTTAQPLSTRVIVNRIWQQYFGRGLVETENDFGTQGSLPSHPELLDWLATELVAREWSLKAMHRLIVTSATYRQSSRARPDLETVDPVNRLLARQSRLRLEGELIRDVALAASGLLTPKLGGPPVFPPQPDGVMTLGQLKRSWVPSNGPDRYRRGLYTHLWRATPHPALAVFDAPDGFSACTRRLRSNTPLQALTLLNDAQFFEFAGALAQRVQAEGPPDPAGKIAFAFRLCVARPPRATELERLQTLFEHTLADSTGEPAQRQTEAWTTVARVLLNLDEAITRE